MKDKNTQTELEDNIKYGILDVLETLNSQTEDDTECVIIEIDEDEVSQLKVTKEDVANMIRVEIEDAFPLILTFDRYDDNWNVFFKITEFQKQRRAAIKKLVEYGQKAVFYLKDYKNLMVSFYGEIIGDISEVEMDKIFEVAYMVERLNEKYSFISINFKDLKYEFDNI